jgi:hypothetical protein
MNNSQTVKIIHCVGYIPNNNFDSSLIQFLFQSSKPLEKISIRIKTHHDVNLVFGFKNFFHVNDVRMVN